MASLLKGPKLPKMEVPGLPKGKGVVKSISFIGNKQALREIEELIKKVEVIENDCVYDNKQDEIDSKDDFIKLKQTMYNELHETKELIRSRHHIQAEKGNTVEAIQKGAKITSNLNTLDQNFAMIKEVFKKQTKQKKKYGDEELDKRFKDMQVLKRQIEECRNLFKNAAQMSEQDVRTLTDFRAQMQAQGIEMPPPSQEWREPTAEEKQTMDRWNARDKEFDQQVGEIGEVVDRLGDIAVNIGEKADKQAQMIVDLSRQADEANDELIDVNNRIRNLMTKGSSMNFFCKLLLTIVLLAMIGYIISAVIDKIKKA